MFNFALGNWMNMKEFACMRWGNLHIWDESYAEYTGSQTEGKIIFYIIIVGKLDIVFSVPQPMFNFALGNWMNMKE